MAVFGTTTSFPSNNEQTIAQQTQKLQPNKPKHQTKQALEAFVSRAPAGARPSLDALLTAALGHLRHDPNFADDADVDGSGAYALRDSVCGVVVVLRVWGWGD